MDEMMRELSSAMGAEDSEEAARAFLAEAKLDDIRRGEADVDDWDSVKVFSRDRRGNEGEQTMIAYHGDVSLKADLLSELAEHRRLDQIVKGTYGEGSNGDWRGCAVGCSIHSLNRKRGTKYAVSDHGAYEAGFGIPRSLAYLEDGIFENLPDPLYLDWPARFSAAIRPGADLSKVIAHFLHWLMVDPEGCRQFADARGLECIDRVAALYQRELSGDSPTQKEWDAARDAAGAARDAAGAAARDAAGAAARDAAWAARDAAWAARDAAGAAAGAAAYIRMADKVIELLEAA